MFVFNCFAVHNINTSASLQQMQTLDILDGPFLYLLTFLCKNTSRTPTDLWVVVELQEHKLNLNFPSKHSGKKGLCQVDGKTYSEKHSTLMEEQ